MSRSYISILTWAAPTTQYLHHEVHEEHEGLILERAFGQDEQDRFGRSNPS
jgi:hypothetical protein